MALARPAEADVRKLLFALKSCSNKDVTVGEVAHSCKKNKVNINRTLPEGSTTLRVFRQKDIRFHKKEILWIAKFSSGSKK